MLDAAGESWGMYRQQEFAVPPIELRFIVQPEGELTSQPLFRTQGQLFSAVSDRHNFAAFESRHFSGCCFVSEKTAAHHLKLRIHFLESMVYTLLAVSFFTLAIPIRLEHNAITLAFAVEGAALVWIGFRTLGPLLRPVGYLLFVITAFRLLEEPPEAGTFLFNARFGSYFLLIACLGFSLWSARDSSDDEHHNHSAESACLAIATNFFTLFALSLEFWDLFGRVAAGRDHYLAQHLSISIFWTCYAALLLVLGIQRPSPLLRWQALFLLGIVVAKVFLYDLSFLARAYRILSFLILGSALLAVSFFYQRKLARARSSP